MEAPPEPRSRRRARALPPQHGPAMASHVASTWPRPCCTAQPPPAALYARTTVRLRLWVPSMGTDKMPVRPGRPCAAMAMATRLMAETGMMMPASGSDGSCWSKVAEMQQLRMPPHERQWSTTLFPLSRSRTPPSRSQHLHSCTLEDRVAARISLLGRGCGALGAERGNKTSKRVVSTFCPLLDPPRFSSSLLCIGPCWRNPCGGRPHLLGRAVLSGVSTLARSFEAEEAKNIERAYRHEASNELLAVRLKASNK